MGTRGFVFLSVSVCCSCRVNGKVTVATTGQVFFGSVIPSSLGAVPSFGDGSHYTTPPPGTGTYTALPSLLAAQ